MTESFIYQPQLTGELIYTKALNEGDREQLFRAANDEKNLGTTPF